MGLWVLSCIRELFYQVWGPAVKAARLSRDRLRVPHTEVRRGVPYLADHYRALTASFDSKLLDVGNPFLPHRGR